MRVSEVTAFGGPEVLQPAARPWPRPGPDEVVVEIAAANVNPTDLAARSGAHRRRLPDLEPPFVPGWDLAGVVGEVGSRVSDYASGEWVVGMIPWVRIGGRVGAYAEAAAVDPDWLAPLPDGLDAVTAATVPLNTLTARQALDLIAAGGAESVLITGASGAVGGFATQLAAQDDLHVISVASDADEDWVESLGAAEVLPRGADLATVGPVDAVLDAVPLGEPAAQAVRDGGTIVFTRRIELTTDRDLRVETPLVHSDAATLERLTRQVASGRLRTRIARTVDLEDAAAAHALLEGGGLRGKVVLTTR
jgi:NADPH:quinone reductase